MLGAKTKVPGAGLLASARRRVVVFRSRRAAGALVLGLAGERPGPVVVWGAGREVRRGGKKVGAGPKAGAGAGAGARKKVSCAGGGAAAGKTGVEGCDGQHGGQRSGAEQRSAEHGRATMKRGEKHTTQKRLPIHLLHGHSRGHDRRRRLPGPRRRHVARAGARRRRRRGVPAPSRLGAPVVRRPQRGRRVRRDGRLPHGDRDGDGHLAGVEHRLVVDVGGGGEGGGQCELVLVGGGGQRGLVLVGGGGGVGGLPVLEEGGGVVGGEVLLVVEGSLGDGGEVGEDVLVEWGFFGEGEGGGLLGGVRVGWGVPGRGGGSGGLTSGTGEGEAGAGSGMVVGKGKGSESVWGVG